jgi:hypothetical protein
MRTTMGGFGGDYIEHYARRIKYKDHGARKIMFSLQMNENKNAHKRTPPPLHTNIEHPTGPFLTGAYLEWGLFDLTIHSFIEYLLISISKIMVKSQYH